VLAPAVSRANPDASVKPPDELSFRITFRPPCPWTWNGLWLLPPMENTKPAPAFSVSWPLELPAT